VIVAQTPRRSPAHAKRATRPRLREVVDESRGGCAVDQQPVADLVHAQPALGRRCEVEEHLGLVRRQTKRRLELGRESVLYDFAHTEHGHEQIMRGPASRGRLLGAEGVDPHHMSGSTHAALAEVTFGVVTHVMIFADRQLKHPGFGANCSPSPLARSDRSASRRPERTKAFPGESPNGPS
jgi:hypothetical protein